MRSTDKLLSAFVQWRSTGCVVSLTLRCPCRFSSPWTLKVDGAMVSFRPCGSATTPSARGRAASSPSGPMFHTPTTSKSLLTLCWILCTWLHGCCCTQTSKFGKMYHNTSNRGRKKRFFDDCTNKCFKQTVKYAQSSIFGNIRFQGGGERNRDNNPPDRRLDLPSCQGCV